VGDRAQEVDREERLHSWSLFALLFLTFCYFHQGGFSNQNTRFDLTLALAFEGRVAIDSFHHNTLDKASRGGSFYAEKAPVASYLALPVPLASRLFLSATDLAKGRAADVLLYLSTILGVSLLSALSALAFRRLLRRINPVISSRRATLLTAATYLGTLALPYSTVLFGHQLAAAFLIFGLYFGLAAGAPGGRFAEAAGAVLALTLAVASEYPAALPGAALAVAILACANPVGRRRLLKAAPIALIPAGLLAIHNAASFGSPFALGYGQLGGTPFGSQMSKGFFGVAWPDPGTALQLLFGGYRGLFIYCPILLIAVTSFWEWPRPLLRRLGLPLLGGAVATVALASSYAYWQGGVCFGARHLVTAIPLLALGLAFLPPGWSGAAVVLAVPSIAINLTGTATTLFLSEYDLAPLTRTYPRLLAEGAVSLNPLDFWAAPAETPLRWAVPGRHPWASFNLGELVRLRGLASLVPLLLGWGAFLFFSLQPVERPLDNAPFPIPRRGR
jgi:hypothetical protein